MLKFCRNFCHEFSGPGALCQCEPQDKIIKFKAFSIYSENFKCVHKKCPKKSENGLILATGIDFSKICLRTLTSLNIWLLLTLSVTWVLAHLDLYQCLILYGPWPLSIINFLLTFISINVWPWPLVVLSSLAHGSITMRRCDTYIHVPDSMLTFNFKVKFMAFVMSSCPTCNFC